MGVTKIKLVIKNTARPSRKAEGDFLVDSGAHYTVVPAKLVRKIGLKKAHEQEFVLADGRIVKRAIGSALIQFQNRELAVPVVLGEENDGALLGVTTLESFGLMLDPFKREIYPSKLMLG